MPGKVRMCCGMQMTSYTVTSEHSVTNQNAVVVFKV